MEDKFYSLGFSVFSGIGPGRYKTLLDFFGDAKSAWTAEIGALKESGIGEALAERVDEFRKEFSVSEYVQKLKEGGVKFFAYGDEDYPKLLGMIKNPPIVLYVKGDFDFKILEKQKPVAIVGTRRITTYGTQVTRMVVADLAQAGCVIVSGLALGVDACAHLTTIENGGYTIAVLGSGVDVCTPAENETLYGKILDSGGAIVSEYPLGQVPVKGSFPARNRIIAGMSEAVVVTEGTVDSGALITAKDALKNNRKVFAVPGPITSSYSKAPNSLIVDGALPITGGADVFRALDLRMAHKQRKIVADNKDEEMIINLLQDENMHVDDLVKRLCVPAGKVGTVLSMMEMKGMIRNCGSGVFGLAEIG